MTTKKIVMIAAAVVIVLALLVGVFVGGVVFFTLYSFGTSDAAATAKEFLRNNQQLKRDIGEVKDFGTFVSGNISINNGVGSATINLKVIGEKRPVNATVELVYANGRPWRVTAASYKNEQGQTIALLNPYESPLLVPALVSLV
jgi:Cytochrome oxidase complex assembly protein 1